MRAVSEKPGKNVRADRIELEISGHYKTRSRQYALSEKMARKQFDLIVFDWDGTLMDSTAAIVKCIQAAAKDLGLPIPDNKAASYVIGLGLQDAMQAALPDVDPKHYPRMAERYRYHYLAQDQGLTLFDRTVAARIFSCGCHRQEPGRTEPCARCRQTGVAVRRYALRR
jgi:hypothetical protein